MKKFLIKAFVTGFFVGNIKYAPGTFGSLLAFPLLIILAPLTLKFQFLFNISKLNINEQEVLALITVNLFCCIMLFIAGVYAVDKYIVLFNKSDQDPKEVVIDEVVGQMLTNILSFLCFVFASYSKLNNYMSETMIALVFVAFLPFVTFRFFDIVKPWPINLIDSKMKNGMGVMLDDVAAAIFASVICYAVTFLVIS